MGFEVLKARFFEALDREGGSITTAGRRVVSPSAIQRNCASPVIDVRPCISIKVTAENLPVSLRLRQRLKSKLSPVTFDAPGHGDATGESMTILDLRDIVAALDGEHGPFETVVAHSLGVTATFLALREGRLRTERVVAISGVPDFAYLVDRFCVRLGLRARLNAELRSRVERELFPGEEDIWSRFSVPRTPPTDGPESVLVVHDEDDDMVEPACSRALADTLGERAELVVTWGLGHRRILGDPQVAASVRDFVVRERAALPDPSPQPAAG